MEDCLPRVDINLQKKKIKLSQLFLTGIDAVHGSNGQLVTAK